jgi:hypothetical protein
LCAARRAPVAGGVPPGRRRRWRRLPPRSPPLACPGPSALRPLRPPRLAPNRPNRPPRIHDRRNVGSISFEEFIKVGQGAYSPGSVSGHSWRGRSRPGGVHARAHLGRARGAVRARRTHPPQANALGPNGAPKSAAPAPPPRLAPAPQSNLDRPPQTEMPKTPAARVPDQRPAEL